MNVLAGLAEGVLDAILERQDDPGRDPFAVALARYRSGGVPQEAAASWRGAPAGRLPGRAASSVLRRLDRDLLADVVGYARGESPAGRMEAPFEEGPASPTLGVIGAGGAMPSLELGNDGTWHVAKSAATPEARRASDKTRAGVPTLASRYPRDRY